MSELVGTLDGAGPRATVDRGGGIVAGRATWELDWWIGADDRWHVPEREAAVRQTLVDDMPVVQTSMRVPGGDAVQRVLRRAPAGECGRGRRDRERVAGAVRRGAGGARRQRLELDDTTVVGRRRGRSARRAARRAGR